jgi:hypothetical protein
MTVQEYFSLNTLPENSYVYAHSSDRFAIGILKFKDEVPYFEKICGNLTDRLEWFIAVYDNYTIVSKEEVVLKIFES